MNGEICVQELPGCENLNPLELPIHIMNLRELFVNKMHIKIFNLLLSIEHE